MSCSFSFEKEAVATLARGDLDQTYTLDISQVPDYLKVDTYHAIVGNSYVGFDASQRAMFREVRYWNLVRSLSEISRYRYKQVNPVTHQGLLTYLRLANGAYNGFDLLWTNPDANVTQKSAALHKVTQVSDSSLIVCPQATYFNNGKCYVSPYVSSAITTLLVNVNGADYWRIGTQFSDVVDTSDQINYIWEVNDVVISSYIAGKN